MIDLRKSGLAEGGAVERSIVRRSTCMRFLGFSSFTVLLPRLEVGNNKISLLLGIIRPSTL